ncbi:antimicrobial peptide NK-lysin [Amia ocellicauda]|uniref:antimicrobial peptide NK-lysin n=1 Tax=Amia ocellicauda TaxID=2972642 RepID=UPI0034648ACF
MSPLVFLCLLVFSSALVDLGTANDNIRELYIKAQEGSGDTEEIPGMCSACKSLVKWVKSKIPEGANQDDVDKSLHEGCNKLGWGLKSICKKLINKYLSKLISEIMKNEDPKETCVNIKLCKSQRF